MRHLSVAMTRAQASRDLTRGSVKSGWPPWDRVAVMFLALAGLIGWLAPELASRGRAARPPADWFPADPKNPLVAELNGHSWPDHRGVFIRALAFSPDGRTLASGDTYGMIKLWDLPTGKEH